MGGTVKFAYQLMEKDPKYDPNFLGQVRGEVAEVLLDLLIMDLGIRNKSVAQDWVFYKSLILRDIKNPNSSYFTEADFVLFTPMAIVCLESKSYSGTKTLTGNGVLKRKSSTVDVFTQNAKHVQVLRDTFTPFMNDKSQADRAFKSAMFNCSLGALTDYRTEEAKAMFPCLDPFTLQKYLCDVMREPHVFNMPMIKHAVNIMVKKQDTMHGQHLAYVQELNKNRK